MNADHLEEKNTDGICHSGGNANHMYIFSPLQTNTTSQPVARVARKISSFKGAEAPPTEFNGVFCCLYFLLFLPFSFSVSWRYRAGSKKRTISKISVQSIDFILKMSFLMTLLSSAAGRKPRKTIKLRSQDYPREPKDTCLAGCLFRYILNGSLS